MKIRAIVHEAEEGAIGLKYPLFPVVRRKLRRLTS